MIIDAHNHADWHGHDFNKFIANMDRYHIDRTWILSWETPASEYDPSYLDVIPQMLGDRELRYPVPFALGLAYKQKAPDRFILGYCPDPRLPDAIDRLKAAVRIYGVQVCGELKLRMMYDDWDALAFYRAAGEMGLPVTLHFDYEQATATGKKYPRPNYWYGGDMDTLENMLKKCPGTNFLGHAPGFWCHISDDELGLTIGYPTGPVKPGGRIQQLLDRYPNFYCDISGSSGCNGLSRDLEYSRKLILAHPDRFVYARDYFDNQHQELIGKLALPREVEELLYHGNAQRLVGPEKQ